MAERTGYSNPAKLINYMRQKKARETKGYRDVPEYISRLEAFAKLNQHEQSDFQKEQKRLSYAKIIAQKKLKVRQPSEI